MNDEEEETCDCCGKQLTDCKRECHKEGDPDNGGYCYCQNSDCTNPEPKSVIPSEYTNYLLSELDQIQKQLTAVLKEIAKWTKKEGK